MLTRRDLSRTVRFYQHGVDVAVANSDDQMLHRTLLNFYLFGDFRRIVSRYSPSTNNSSERIWEFYNEFLYCLFRKLFRRRLGGKGITVEINIKNVLEHEMTWNANQVDFLTLITVGGDEPWD